MVEEIVRDGSELADGSVKRGGSGEVWLGEHGPARTQNVVVERVVEAGALPTIEGDPIAMCGTRWMSPSTRKRRTSSVIGPREYVLRSRPSNAATIGRRSRF